MFVSYRCPKCHNTLQRSEGPHKLYHCIQNHTYDIAKEGYVNLLLVDKKKSKQPGDDSAMVKSRTQFLASGYYQPLIKNLQEGFVASVIDGASMIDLGCGEGFYTSALLSCAKPLAMHGIDISKPAIKAAAKRKAAMQVAVASTFDIPYGNHSFDAALSIFAPFSVNEAIRTLKPGGTLCTVGPGATHLDGLANAIYAKVQPHKKGFAEPINAAGLQLQSSSQLEYEVTVKSGDIQALLGMTPYYWTATEQQQQSLGALNTLKTKIHFVVHIYQLDA